MISPQVGIFTTMHPANPTKRNRGSEFAKPVGPCLKLLSAVFALFYELFSMYFRFAKSISLRLKYWQLCYGQT